MTTVVADAPLPDTPAVSARIPRHRLALAVLLIGTAVLYLWDLGSQGWANSFYSGAVQAMTKDWTAFFFGSSDAGNIVTVDKPPASLWVMALSARIFGLSSWSMLVPQVLLGVASVALLYAAVRRVAGPGAGLLAGTALALTPVAVEMFRYNNPDALLVLLMVGAAYATVRATETASTRWLLLAGVCIGLGFMTKMAQALVPLPALALAFLVAAPTGLWHRIRLLLMAGVAMIVTGGWWYVIVELWPTDSRPYIGGSDGDSAVELALGYNGLGRIFGNGGGRGGPPSGGGPGGGGSFGSESGILRMFDTQNGVFAGWLLPAALALLLIGCWLTRRAPRTDATRAALIIWGGWTVLTGLVFSLAQGIYHSYYTVALAPGIAALVGIGGALLWQRRTHLVARIALAVIVAGTAVWAVVQLGRSPDFLPWLSWAIGAVAVIAVPALLLAGRGLRRWSAAIAAALLLTTLAAPAAAASQVLVKDGSGGMGGVPGLSLGNGQDGPDAGRGPVRNGPDGQRRPGGPGSAATDPAMVALLRSAGTRWAAATVSAQGAAGLALASDTTVMGIGGFSGGDPAPTLAEFQAFVAAGEVRYFVADGMGRGGPGGRNSEIADWVTATFASTTVGGSTVYDLTRPLA